jgi:misacylated tRNA(Ala) deacylase
MTEFLFRDDPYLADTSATVIAVTAEGGIILDRTVFYAASGGQPGDTGLLRLADGGEVEIATTVHPDGDKTRIIHVPAAAGALPQPGDGVTATLDWNRRHRLMRMHTALHLLSVVLPYPVTGGSVGEGKGRLDFDMPEAPEDVDALTDQLDRMVDADYPVTAEWITDAEMTAQPDLIKTMNVKPPMGQGRVRLIRIGDVDLQPCGGTHVRSTGEIGRLTLGKIEKKGKQNRRVSLMFAESP